LLEFANLENCLWNIELLKQISNPFAENNYWSKDYENIITVKNSYQLKIKYKLFIYEAFEDGNFGYDVLTVITNYEKLDHMIPINRNANTPSIC